MRLLRLRLKNLNSIRQEVTLDLENGPLSETSLFAITGKTGAGKTTLLDALSVALYHKTPRLYSSSTKNAENLLSQGCQEGFAEVLFEVNKKRYLSEWHVKRTRGNNLQSSVKLIDVNTEKLLNDKKNQNPVPQILGLDFNSFCRSVLLAQGEFAAFLKADSDEKRKLLENVTGLGFYVELGELLNEQRKVLKGDYESLQKILESMSPADETAIKATRDELTTIQTELKQKQQQKQQLRTKVDAEKKRFENWKVLQQSQEQLAQLQQKKPEIEALTKELQRAKDAAELIPIQNAFEREQKNLAEIQEKLNQTQAQVVQARNQLGQQRTSCQAKTEAAEKAKKSSVHQFELLDLAAQEETKANALFAEAQKRQHELNKVEQELIEMRQVLEQKQTQRQQIEQQLQQAEKLMQQLAIPAEYSKLMSELQNHLAEIRVRQKKLSDITREGQEKKNELKKYQRTEQQLLRELNQLEAQIQFIQAERVAVEESLNQILATGDAQTLEERRQAALSLQEVALTYENINTQKSELTTEQQQLERKCQDLEFDLKEIRSRISKTDLSISRLKEKITRLETEEKNAALSGYIFQLRSEQLQSGQPCPVCGSLEHPWATRVEPEMVKQIEQIQAENEKTQSELEAEQKALKKSEQEESAFTAALQQYRQRLIEIKQKIEAFSVQLTSCLDQWIPVLNDRNVSTQKIKSEVAFCESQLKQVRQAQEKLQRLETQRQSVNSKAELIKNEQKHLQSQIAELDKLLEERRNNFLSTRNEITDLEQKILNQLPPAYQADGAENGVKQLEINIQQAEQTAKELAQSQVASGRITTSIAENEKMLQQTQQRFNGLKTEINHYQEQANELVTSAREKTGGLPAKTARTNLEQKLQNLEAEQNAARQLLQNTKEQVTEVETRWQEFSQLLEASQLNFEKAQEAYRNAALKANFKSLTAHQQALRSSDWQETQETVLNTYRKQLFSVEQTIERLSQMFEPATFNVEQLKTLEAQEKELEQSIEAHLSRCGTLQEKLDQQQHDLALFEQRQKDLVQAQTEYERWQTLYELIGANKLRDYALKSMFNHLIRFANHQMARLTTRYILKVKDMRDLVVVDTWNAGEERPVETLSGGESFLTSLALALALSELSKGRAQLESLFLDEGFGSLDNDTLELALDALESLRLSGRKVGIISHVQELTRRIPVRINVKKKGDGSSSVAVEGTI